VTLQWSSVPDAGYWVCWDTSNNNTCDTGWWPNGGGTSRSLNGLGSGTYFWQVRAQTGNGMTDADSGSWWSFTVGGASAVAKLSPAHGSSGLGSTVTLQWTAVPDSGYWVCWDTTNDNSCDTGWWPNGGASSRTVTGLAPGTYFWQVRAQTPAGLILADGGAWYSFTVTGFEEFAMVEPATFGFPASFQMTPQPPAIDRRRLVESRT
jgi:hypothetical protein